MGEVRAGTEFETAIFSCGWLKSDPDTDLQLLGIRWKTKILSVAMPGHPGSVVDSMKNLGGEAQTCFGFDPFQPLAIVGIERIKVPGAIG